MNGTASRAADSTINVGTWLINGNGAGRGRPLSLLPAAPPAKRALLGETLVQRGLVSRKELEFALGEQSVTREPLGLILVRLGFLRRKTLIDTLAEIAPERLSAEEVRDVRPSVRELLEHRVYIAAEPEGGDALFAAAMGPQAAARRMLAAHYPEKSIRFVPFSPGRFDDFIRRQCAAVDAGANGGHPSDGPEAVLDRIVEGAFRADASDIHLSAPGPDSYAVLYRVDGERRRFGGGSRQEFVRLLAHVKDRAGMDVAETRRRQDGSWTEQRSGRPVDFRVATYPEKGGEVAVVRILDPDRANPDLRDLGISRIGEWEWGIGRKDGLCLICGPTGSGKTTTLNATMRSMDRISKTICSVEDPVEYRLPLVNQTSVNRHLGFGFAEAIKAFMRGDPDVIAVGEVRDAETAAAMVQAAETGHLVLATLHSGSIRQAVARLRHLGIEPHDLLHLLRCVLVQRLVRTVCRACGGGGCPACGGSGYRGRTVVSEVKAFRGEDEVARLLETHDRWWPDMSEDAAEKAAAGITTDSEIEGIATSEGSDVGGLALVGDA